MPLVLSDPGLVRAAFNSFPAGVMITGADGTIRWVNPAFTALAGYTPEEAIGQNARILETGEPSAALYEELWRAALAGGWRGELVNRRRNGELYWVRLTVTAVSGPSGGVSHFVTVMEDLTELRQARERNELLPVAYQAVDESGRILDVNRAWLAMLGYEREEVVGRPFSGFLPPDQLDALAVCFEKFRATGQIRCAEGVVLRKDGSRVPVVVDGQVEYDALGRFRRGHWALEDATERREAERALRFTHLAVENAPDASFWVARDGRLIDVNEAACRSLGYSREELLAMTIRDIDPSLTRESWATLGPRVESGLAVFESRHRRKDGSLFPVEVTCNVVLFEGQKYYCSFVRDISERKRAEGALRQSEERFRSVVESAPQGIFLQAGGVFRYLNPAACRLFGAEAPGPLLGQRIVDRVHPDCRAIVQERIAQVNEGRTAVPSLEEKYLRLDGTAMDVEIFAAPFDLQGERGAIVFIRDIGERKRAEQERLHLAEQLRQSQKLESIGRLAGGVAHDFNNLLTVINGYCDLLLRMAPGPMRPALEQISKSGESAAHLTQQLLAFSLRQEAQFRPVDLNAIVSAAGEPLGRLVGENIRVTMRLQTGLGLVMADAGQLRQALLNLAVNARDAMPSGGELLIETMDLDLDEECAPEHPGVVPGPFVTLAVTDTGCGMDEETRRRVFDPFFTTKEKGRGAGLGLATVYGVVKQSRGWIRVSSRPGQGATFRVYLPRLAAGLAHAPPAAAGPAPLAGHETILIVEDQPGVRRLAADVLASYGYRLLQAANGAEALEAAQNHAEPIHLLLTDVVMPGMNGRELVERLQPQRPGMRVLYMSGYTEDVIARDGALDPRLAYIAKPFAPAVLAAKVRQTLDAERE